MVHVKTRLKCPADWWMDELTRLKEIGLALVNAFAVYDQRIVGTEKYKVMLDLLQDYEPVHVRMAIRAWMTQPPEKGHKPRPPMPNELIALMQPQLTPEQEGSDIAGLICGAISRYGWNNGKAAKAALPAIGWQIIQQNYGGWQRFCETVTERDLVNTRAQLRDQIAAALRRQGVAAANDPSKSLTGGRDFKALKDTGRPTWQSAGAIAQSLVPPR